MKQFHAATKNYQHYLGLFSSCKDLKSLLQIHAQLIVSGLQQHPSTLTHLINSYSSFQRCNFSRSVFNSAQNPSVRLWNYMIRAHTRAKEFKQAQEMYHSLLKLGLEPDKYTFNFALKACTAALDFEEGVLVHREVERKGLEYDVFIGTSLIDVYCKMGEVKCAGEVFDRMPEKDVVACNALIAGLAKSEDPKEAVEFFRRMQCWGMGVNLVSLFNLVPAVSRLGDIDSCRCIHGYVVRRELGSEVSNGLVDMYCKCGDVDVARRVFEMVQGGGDDGGVLWGTMMAGYASNRCFVEVLVLFDCLKGEGCRMNKVCIMSALLAATEMRDLEKGREIHLCALEVEVDSDVSVATSIMTMYAKCGEIEKAMQLFERLGERDLVAWSALISACVQSGFPEVALSLFRDRQNENLKPCGITLVSVLAACGELSYLKFGKSIHCYAVKADIDSDISTGTALVSMYAKCGFFTPALIIFNRMPSKDVVTWNALINAYTQIGDVYHAIDMLDELWLSGIKPDAGTMVGMVSACSLLNDLNHGTCIHGQIIKNGFEHDAPLKNALIGMYCKCGDISSAEFLFNRTKLMKDVVSWNVMIAGYMQGGYAREAISVFHQMKLENCQPNLVTFVSILPAVAYLAALREGMAFHACIIQNGFLSNTLVGNCLIDMYAKCGQLDHSEKCFEEMELKDKVSWNTLLAAYAMHGQGDHAIALLSLMQKSCIQLDSVSFISLLSACRHAGLIKEGKEVFQVMCEKHHLEPELEHYACMVDLLGRAGFFDEALDLINTMPMEPDAGVWGALLGACRMHSNAKLGEVALSHLVNLEPTNATNYIALSDIHAHSARWGDACKTRSKMKSSGSKKMPGCSWVEVQNRVHTLQAGDYNYRQLGTES
ncbi:putative tetratricopeptide-like helical domain-containing protein [Rosa chinensis]|uniref:Putative tetratricopeptide-like helical domain-containing protein n=1 Tax=Rosa chinensis TaxID=74649 RepID=A0A2P6SK73_ROSCH|nr:pentatricopeptide repeat-containing protein At2g39620 [Rosa chinensis]PRQ59072.1 putative tetratricopeptide-like helical domain-containing protein [Rosa chinensis]